MVSREDLLRTSVWQACEYELWVPGFWLSPWHGSPAHSPYVCIHAEPVARRWSRSDGLGERQDFCQDVLCFAGTRGGAYSFRHQQLP